MYDFLISHLFYWKYFLYTSLILLGMSGTFDCFITYDLVSTERQWNDRCIRKQFLIM